MQSPPSSTSARLRGDVFLTGATGFLGMATLRRLLEDPARHVWALVRAPSDQEARGRLRSALAEVVAEPDDCMERVTAVRGARPGVRV